MLILDRAQAAAARVIGPDAIGLINPAAQVKVGAIGGGDPAQTFSPGRIGVIMRGGKAAEIGRAIKQVGLGVSTAIGIGGDRLIGTDPATLLPLFQRDQETDGVVLVGEPETQFVEDVAEVLGSRRYLKPLIAVIGGQVIRALPEGDAVAQATAILDRRAARLNIRQDTLREVGAIVTGDLSELPLYLSLVFKNQAYLGDGPTLSS
jgi:succinyl-CoA synthetase alpha subunit